MIIAIFVIPSVWAAWLIPYLMVNNSTLVVEMFIA